MFGQPDVRQGGIFALDLSGIVGWAYGHAGQNASPEFGTWRLPEGPRLGPKYVGYENELIAALEKFKPKLVVMEAPLPSMRQGSTNVARQQFGLAAYTEGECCRARIQLREQAASTVRKAVMGQGRFPTGTAKEHVIAWCREQGWMVQDDNAADACVLWAYSCKIALKNAP